MKREEAEQIIAVDIIKKQVESNIQFLSDFSKVKNALKYDNKTINKQLQKDFDMYTSILQKLVDEYFFNYYEVSSFIVMTLDNMDYAINKNLETLNSMKKLIKFIQ